MTTTSSVSLLIDQEASEKQFVAFVNDLTRSKINARVVRRPPDGPFMSLDWLIPTGIILFIAKPYFETFVKKAAEDHYAILKSATSKLWKKFFGPKPEIERFVYGPEGVEKVSIFSRSFSVTAEDVRGVKMTLLFLKDTKAKDFALAVEKFEILMLHHHSSRGNDALSRLLDSRELPPREWQQLIYLNPQSRQLVLLDYVKSSMHGQLVGDEIPPRQE